MKLFDKDWKNRVFFFFFIFFHVASVNNNNSVTVVLQSSMLDHAVFFWIEVAIDMLVSKQHLLQDTIYKQP